MGVSVKLGTNGQILLTSVKGPSSGQLKICPRAPSSVLTYSIVNQLHNSPDINRATLARHQCK